MRAKPLLHTVTSVAIFVSLMAIYPAHRNPPSRSTLITIRGSGLESILDIGGIENGYWVLESPLPIARQSGVVLALDGFLYVLGGYGGEGTGFRYDPTTKTWTQLATMSPLITHPGDGCLGYNDQGESIIVLFPDNWGDDTHSIMVYNVAHDSWSRRSMPSPMPSNGIFAPDIASDAKHNVCYVSGGATYPGAGDRNTLYAYYPATNTAQQLPSFTTPRGYHASWFVSQWGEAGYVCIAGGLEFGNPSALDSTQCYDVAQSVWREENADLGPLPRRFSGSADALKVINGVPQLWIMGGVSGFETGRTYYYDANQEDWLEGPKLAYALQATEGDALGDELYVMGGVHHFALLDYNQHLLSEDPPPCQQAMLFHDDFEGTSNWTRDGLWNIENETDTCGSLVAPFPSSNTAWYYGSKRHGCTYDTGGWFGTIGSLTLNAVLSTTNVQQVTVTFWGYTETECGSDLYCQYDFRKLDLSFDEGTSWEVIWREGADDAWKQILAASRFYPGDSLLVRFTFDSYGPINNDYLGWFIDNVEVTGCFEQPPQTWFEEDDPAIAYSGLWKSLACPECSGGAQNVAARRGATAEFSFTGTGIRWFMTTANRLGKARVYLDGVDLGFVDLYSPTPQYQQVWETTGLSPGAHTLRIEVSGKKHPRSTGRTITLDALEVLP